MKKVARSVWICALSGLAFVVACTTQNGLTRSQIRQLTKKRQALIERIKQIDEMKGDEVDYDFILWERPIPLLYGSPIVPTETEGFGQ